MPQGSRPKRSQEECPNCRTRLIEIWHDDGFGVRDLLETHCNRCGYARDEEGKIRSITRSEREKSTQREKDK